MQEEIYLQMKLGLGFSVHKHMHVIIFYHQLQIKNIIISQHVKYFCLF
jgi:hypothetical protein